MIPPELIDQLCQDAAQARAAGIDSEFTEFLSVSGIQQIQKDTPLSQVEVALSTLAELVEKAEPIRRAVAREAAIRKLKSVGIGSPAALVDAALGREPEATETGKNGTAILLADVEPWESPVDGAALLTDIVAIVDRHAILPAGAAVAFALWLRHTYVLDAFDVSPYLGVTSPEKRCGKTVVLELTQAMARKPLPAANITPAALFRTIEAHTPTLLIDELDTFLKDNEELRGVLNSGHRKATAVVIRLAGDDHEPRTYSTWCPKIIAMIGNLPETLADRSIPITMRRKTPDEETQRIRFDRLMRECEPIRQKAARWSDDHIGVIRDSEPDVPEALNDRAQDLWRPLLAIAEVVGKNWTGKASSPWQ